MQYVIPLPPPLLHTDEDVKLLSSEDDKNMYIIKLEADQEKVSIDHIEIVDDFFPEENETFLISLSPGPDRTFYNYQIQSSRELITVLITDNDGELCHIY